jgi:hypothetical protein
MDDMQTPLAASPSALEPAAPAPPPPSPLPPRSSVEEYKRRYAAKYTSKGREYKGNVLIEALPCYPRTRKALRQKLSVNPHFSSAMREWSALKRRIALKRLVRFFWAMPHVCELADHLWAEMLQSYSRRKPFTAESNRIMQAMYMRAEDSDRDDEVQWVSALTGIPGAGRRTAVSHIANKLFPLLIYHKELDLWQIPVLKIQMPYHGRQGVSLAIAIIEAVHRVFPFPNYLQMYVRPRAGEPELMAAARTLLFVHAVGFLIVEDAQDTGPQPLEMFDENTTFGKPKKKKTPVAWAAGLLFKASRAAHVPLLLVATSELEDVMGKTLDKIRLMYGNGLPHWGPLEFLPPPGFDRAPVDVFLGKIWKLTLLREHPELDDDMRNMFLYHTFGITDFMVKLYYIMQWRMLQEGKETFTQKDVHDYAVKYMGGLSRLAIKMNQLAEGDKGAQAAIAAMPDLVREFHFIRTIGGVTKEVQTSYEQAKKECEKLADPKRKPVTRKKKEAEPRKDLSEPETADVSALEED